MPAASLGDLLDFRGKDCYDNIHNKILFFVKCPLCLCVSAEKRESGGSPERSGHCEQGVLSWDAIAWRDHVRRFDKAMICESENLLGKLVMSFRRKQNSKRSKSIIMLFQSEDRDCVSVVVSDF